jgi:hypothetical protein
MVFSKATTDPSETPIRSSTLGWTLCLTLKYKAKQEMLAKAKDFSLLGAFVNYRLEFFYKVGSW